MPERNRPITKVGVIQHRSEVGSYEDNIERAICMIDQCINEKCDLICLPEAFSTTIDLRGIKDVSEEIPGKTSVLLCQKAKESKTYLAAGVLEKKGDDIYSSTVLIDPNGKVMGIYRRVHIFQLEKNFIKAGGAFEVFETSIGRIGIIMGYDINFPEACRALFKEKAEIIICPSQIPDAFIYSTRLLSLARATENGCYFLLVSSVGENNLARFKYMGNSLIARSPIALDPLSTEYIKEDEIVAQAGNNETIIYANLDLKRLRREQDENPHYKDRVMESFVLAKE